MKFSLAVKDDNTFCYTFTSAKALTYDANKYWLADISGNEMEKELYVDLGLPSGVKWATCNLGATKPQDYGDYYGWGCKEPYATNEDITWTLYFSKIGGTGKNEDHCGTDKDPLKDYVNPTSISMAGTEWDAARQKLGGKWRMPTTEEQQELLNTEYCEWTWITGNGVAGCKVTSKKNGNSIFLPATGFRSGTKLDSAGSKCRYWSSSPGPIVSSKYGVYYSYAWYMSGVSYEFHYYNIRRFHGFAVRPVLE